MRIAVGMSGGVDSSVAAALLKKAGHEVIGVTMMIWEGSKCCSGDAIEHAEWVTKHLGIEHHVYDLVPEFTQEVVTPFIDAYTHGRTPNPCPTCNFRMKFHHLWNTVKANLEVDKMATGHYVRIRHNEDLNRYQLLRGLDHNKDQTYMLYRLSQEQLSGLAFPLGEYNKPYTRQLAAEFGLEPVMNKPDSQDLCFIGDSLADFWKKQDNSMVQTGKIVDSTGKVLGEHKGLVHYTVGQRRGLGIASERPLYVLQLDPKQNQVIVGSNEQTFTSGLDAIDVNWSAIEQPQQPITAYIKIRYRSELIKAEIVALEGNRARIIFAEPQGAVAPGQATVFYDQDEVLLGGGTIDHAVTVTAPEPVLSEALS